MRQSVSDCSQLVDSKDGEMSEWLSAYAAKPLRRDISPELAMNATRAEADEGAGLESEAFEQH